jgi:hypothetical protein
MNLSNEIILKISKILLIIIIEKIIKEVVKDQILDKKTYTILLEIMREVDLEVKSDLIVETIISKERAIIQNIILKDNNLTKKN